MSRQNINKVAGVSRRQCLKKLSLGGAAVLSITLVPKAVEKAGGWLMQKPHSISVQISVDLGHKGPKLSSENKT